MYQTLSLELEKITEKQKLNQEQIKLLERQLDLYDNQNYIFPGVLAENTGIDMNKVYNLLISLESIGYVRRVYEITCNKCADPEYYRYSSLDEIPETIVCNNCFEEYRTLENCLVIFQVIYNG